MEKAVQDILHRINKIYDRYEDRANQMSQEKRMKKGAQIDKLEKQFFTQINKVADNLYTVVQEMDKSSAIKSNADLRESPRLAKECLNDIQNITKKKSLMFKVDENLRKLAESTDEHVTLIRKDLAHAGDSKFLCCGTDGAKKFKKTIELFKISASQWKLLSRLEPKDSVQNFISPKFSDEDYRFVREILQKCWPEERQAKVITQEIIKQVRTGAPSKLVLANEFIYGINREENPSHGLKIYHEADREGDPAASSYLGQIYEEGILLPKDMNKAIAYYQKARKSNDAYASYRLAMAWIRGEISPAGVNQEEIKRAIKILEQAATSDKPSAEAMVELGELYEKGYFEADRGKVYTQPIDLKKAIGMYKKARDLRLPRASNNLGVLYINNKNFSESNPNSKMDNPDVQDNNIIKGKKYLEEAQMDGFPQAFYNLGCLHESGAAGRRDLEQALICFYNGGLKGDHMCRLKFAYQLINQTSIMKEEYEDHYRIAYAWLQKIVRKINVAEENSSYTSSVIAHHYSPEEKAEALFYLGLMTEYGFGVDKSAKRAFSFYLQSADLNYSAAKNKLGDCYFSGYGTKQDRKMAVGCYLQAADEKNSEAMVNMGTIYLNGIDGMVEKNFNKAFEYFIKAIDLNNVNAMIHLSYMYRAGLGFEPNPQMAKKLLEDAAKNRSATALYMLRQMGGQYDERVLFHNLDNQFFSPPKRINLNEIVPFISTMNK